MSAARSLVGRTDVASHGRRLDEITSQQGPRRYSCRSVYRSGEARPEGKALKVCTSCARSDVEFYDSPSMSRVGKCKDCFRAYKREYKKRNPPTFKPEWSRSARLRKYGLTVEDRQKIIDSQNGLCAICQSALEINTAERMNRTHVDHDHETGSVRGILCRSCNVGIGHFRDDPSILQSAIDYLERTSSGCK